MLFSFQGRIGRAPYWYFVLAMTVLFGAIFAWVGASLFNAAIVGADGAAPPSGGMAAAAVPVLSLLALWPSLAICAKRWHVALVFNGFIAGTPGANRFGERPA
ncbi:MAG: DUF805 domain-containing protein [Proteobacteria bacterium]|nr:DUF805 domain-containing protein [Pseudomonadota bacterium]